MRALPGLLLFALATVAAYLHLPATVTVHAMRDRIDPLTLAGVSGSAWNGAARRSWWGDIAMKRLSWQADPAPVLAGTVHARLHFELPKDRTLDAHVRWMSGRLWIDALRADLVGSALQRFFQADALQPIGQLGVEVDRSVLDRAVPVALHGHAVWRQASLLGPRVPVFLGDLRVDFRTASPGLVIGVIRDLGGPVRVAGALRMNLVGYRIDMEASPRDPLLSKFGEPLADGSRRLLPQAVWWWRRDADA